MKRLLIYGGTFDPVHKGHENALNAAKSLVRPDLTVIIPNKLPPHKDSPGLVSGEQRMDMLRLAFGEGPGIEYSDYEITHEGKSYSLYTLQHFKKEYKGYELYFIVGSDSLCSFSKWYEYEKLLKLCTLVCVSRQIGDTAELEAAKDFLEKKGGRVIIANAEPIEISSSNIREMIKNGDDPSCYLNENVVKYIYDNSLYRKEVLN